MGEVYLAEHRNIDRKAAIKVLRVEQSLRQDVVQRFFTEARAASVIKHPGIVEIIDCDVDAKGRAYIVMELLEGESLEGLLHRNGGQTRDLRMAVAIVRDIASALSAAHAEHIVHRDLKPANIFMAIDDSLRPPVRVKILDFGIAKLSAAESAVNTRTGSLLGTPVYMSPEQCRGAGVVDHRSDIYSLGCIAFELVCARPPFVREGQGELIVAHTSESPPLLSSIDPALAGSYEQNVLRMLAKDPGDRPQSMNEVIALFDQTLRELEAPVDRTVLFRRGAAPPSPPSLEMLRSVLRPVQPSPLPPPPMYPSIARAPDPGAGFTRQFAPPPHITTLGQTASQLMGQSQEYRAPASRLVPRLVACAIVVAGALFAVRSLRPVIWQRLVTQVTPSERSTAEGPALARPSSAVTAPARPSPPAPPVLPPVPVEAIPSALPAEVSITIDSQPSGAAVWLDDDGKSRGVTPLSLVLPTSSSARTLSLRREGYRTSTTTIVPNESRSLTQALVPLPARPRRKAHANGSGAARSRLTARRPTAPRPTAPAPGGEEHAPYLKITD